MEKSWCLWLGAQSRPEGDFIIRSHEAVMTAADSSVNIHQRSLGKSLWVQQSPPQHFSCQ